MFEASRPFLLFDYFRVPYRLVSEPALTSTNECATLPSCGRIGAEHEGAARLWWTTWDTRSAPLSLPAGLYVIGSIRVYGRMLSDAAARERLRNLGRDWTPETAIADEAGRGVGSIWRNRDGSVFFPFDPTELIETFWSEGYRGLGTSRSGQIARRAALQAYYRVRPVFPRRTQIALRRLLSHIQARTAFPAWPIETALHDLYEFLLRHVAEIARAPVPTISFWPSRYSWALVLTHDVETAAGYRHRHLLREVEEASGFRSSWNFVPKRYRVNQTVVEELLADGFEVGVHGLYHDGRDLESLSTLNSRLPEIRRHADLWRARGFRSPATHRDWDLMPLLGFDYDSSYPDTDPFEPQRGGCCTWLPYFNGGLIELPITLPQDHTLFVILGHEDERVWVEKATYLRSRNGMALLITHPDYMVEAPRLAAYTRFLSTFAEDESLWRALPQEVSGWWRRRSKSSLVRSGSGWEIRGPAAGEASVTFVPPAG